MRAGAEGPKRATTDYPVGRQQGRGLLLLTQRRSGAWLRLVIHRPPLHEKATRCSFLTTGCVGFYQSSASGAALNRARKSEFCSLWRFISAHTVGWAVRRIAAIFRSRRE